MSSLEPVPAAVVYDINVLVTAAATGNSPFRSWPSPPPVSGNASADCLGVIVDAAEFALWLSPHITTNIDRILAQLFKWAQPQIDAYLRAVVMAAEHSGGGIVADVPKRGVAAPAGYRLALEQDRLPARSRGDTRSRLPHRLIIPVAAARSRAHFARCCEIGIPPTLDLATARKGMAAMKKTGVEQWSARANLPLRRPCGDPDRVHKTSGLRDPAAATG